MNDIPEQFLRSWCVASTDDGYVAVETRLFPPDPNINVVAYHPSKQSAVLAVGRLKISLPKLTEMFEKSIAHEVELRNRLWTTFISFAGPDPRKDIDSQLNP